MKKQNQFLMSGLPYSLQCAKDKEEERIKQESDRISEQNRASRHTNRNIIESFLNDWVNQGVELIKLTAYHYRFCKGYYKIDYFPTSGKYHDLQQNTWGLISPAEKINLFPLSIPWNEDL